MRASIAPVLCVGLLLGVVGEAQAAYPADVCFGDSYYHYVYPGIRTEYYRDTVCLVPTEQLPASQRTFAYGSSGSNVLPSNSFRDGMKCRLMVDSAGRAIEYTCGRVPTGKCLRFECNFRDRDSGLDSTTNVLEVSIDDMNVNGSTSCSDPKSMAAECKPTVDMSVPAADFKGCAVDKWGGRSVSSDANNTGVASGGPGYCQKASMAGAVGEFDGPIQVRFPASIGGHYGWTYASSTSLYLSSGTETYAYAGWNYGTYGATIGVEYVGLKTQGACIYTCKPGCSCTSRAYVRR